MMAELQASVLTDPAPAEIETYLAALLANKAFTASPRRRKLLAYVVEQTLAGHADRLKAFDLALAVLGRDERFDAQNDPIVRIEVGRLRRDLAQYYAGAGSLDPVRIAIPKGHYVPVFEAASVEPIPQPPMKAPIARQPGWRIAAVIALGVLVLLGAAWRLGHGGDAEPAQQAGPAVIVQPFAPLDGGESGQLLASGLTASLIADLMRFDGMQVFAGPPESQGGIELPDAAVGLPAFLVAGSVERSTDRVRVAARLTNIDSGQVLWSQSYDRSLTTEEIFDVEAELTAAIVVQLAQGDGVITTAATKQIRQNRPATLFAYDCVQRAFAFRRTFARELYPSVRSCLEEAVRLDPDYAAAWAMLAYAHMDAARFDFVAPPERAGEMAAGVAAAQHAVDLAPRSTTALQSLAALRFAAGDHEEAERIQRQAIALNPNNPEAMAQLGYRLVIRGRWDEGIPLLRAAINRSASVPGWYQATLAVGLYLDGQTDQANRAAAAGRTMCCGVGHAILAVTEAAAGDETAARAALAEAIRQAPILARDPTAFWGTFQPSSEVVERLNRELAKAGLRPLPSKEVDPRS